MMKSYTLDNWDGKLSNLEQKIMQNTPIGGSRNSENQSLKLAGSSQNVQAINDAPKPGINFSEATSNQAGIEVSNNFINELSNGLQRECLSQNMGPSSFMNITSSSLTVPTTPRKEGQNASNEGVSETRTFLPADSPLLRAFHTFNASTSNTDLAKRLEAAISGSPLPRAGKNVDVISLYSTDAEGEVEDETDDVIVAETLLSFSPSKQEIRSHEAIRTSTPSDHNSLFTPPPSEGYPSAEHLFTPPPPSPKHAATSRQRQIMSHVQVPRCPGPKSVYKWLFPRPAAKKSRVSPPVKIHMSLSEALQASLNHNDSIGVLSHGSGQAKKRKEKKDTHEKSRNVAASSSKLPMALGSAATAGSIHPTKKRIYRVEESKNPKKKRKITHVDIDLTLSDNEQCDVVKPKPKLLRPKPKPLADCVAHNKEHAGIQPLVVSVVKPLDLQIWYLNTRFLRDNLRKPELSVPSLTSNGEGSIKRKKSFVKSQTVWFRRIFAQSESEEISVGGPIPTSWDPDFNGISDNDDPIFVQPAQAEEHRPPPPLPTSSTSSKSLSRRVDLAALYRKKEKPEVKATPIKSTNRPKLLETISVPSSTVGLVTPSRSERGLFSKNPSVGLNLEDESSEFLIPVTPSAKALGKRRAISPPLFHASLQPARASPSYENTHPGHIGNQDLDIFIHDYPSSPDFQPPTNMFANGQTLSSRYSPTSHAAVLLPYQTELSPHVDAERFQSVTNIDNLDVQVEHRHFWSSLDSNITEYQYSTVDPTLLGGTPMDHEISEPDYTADFEQSDNEFEKFYEESEHSAMDSDLEESGPVAGPSGIRHHSSSFRSSPSFSQKEYVASVTSTSEPPKRKKRSTSTSTSSLANLSEIVYAPSTAPALRHDALPNRKKMRSPSASAVEPDRSGSEYLPSTTPTFERDTVLQRKPRQTSSSYDPDLLSEKEHTPSTTSDFEPAPVAKGKQREVSLEAVRTLPKRQRVQRQRVDMIDLDAFLKSTDSKIVKVHKALPTTQPAVHSTASKGESDKANKVTQEWPTCQVSSYCHQCRYKSNLVKMLCSGCNAVFCCRCITRRYPDEEFVKAKEGCPRCENYCNCTSCCSRRGEKYVSSRGPPGKRVQPPKVMPDNAEYFGTVYDLNGKRIAVTYAPSGEEGTTPSVVFAQGTGNQLSTTKKSKRVFVGMVQRSWGFGKDAKIKEIKPMARPKKAKKHAVLRTFVGHPDFVKYRVPSEVDILDDLSSLTSLSESEEGPDELEPEVEVFTPESLGDSDVSRAITLALNACGLIIATDRGSTYTLLSSL